MRTGFIGSPTAVLQLAAAVACGIAGCGGDGNPGTPDAPGGPDAGGNAPEFRVDRAGTIALTEESGVYAALYTTAFEIPLPTQTASGAECAVYRRPNPNCPGGCGADACVADNTCAPYATAASAGEIAITGLRQPVTLTPGAFGYTSPTLPADFFADDATIHVAAAGATIPTFSADVGGVVPLDHQVGGSVELHDGEDETIRWTPAGGDARIQLALFLGWHGSPWTDLLICETSDDGELIVPSAVIGAMPYFTGGLFQWPSWIARFRRAWVDSPAGAIEIIASSEARLGLTHEP